MLLQNPRNPAMFASRVFLLVGFILVAFGGSASFLRSDSDHNPNNGELKSGVDFYGDPLPVGAVARIGTVRFRHPYDLCALVFSTDGKTLALATHESGPIRFWESETGKEVGRIPARVRGQGRIAFSFDSKSFVSVEPEMMRVWEVATQKELFRLNFERAPNRADRMALLSPDGKILISAGRDSELRLWDMADGKLLDKISVGRGDIGSMTFSSDGTLLAVTRSNGSNRDDGRVHLRSWPGGKLLHELSGWGGLSNVAFSPEGKRIFAAGRLHVKGGPRPIVRVWDTATGQEVQQIRGFRQDVFALSVLADNNSLVTLNGGDPPRIWDLGKAEVRHSLIGHQPDRVGLCVASPDGKTVITARHDGFLQMWDPATGKELQARPIPGRTFGILADGTALITKGDTIEQWETATGKHLKQLSPGPTPLYCELSPDGRLLAEFDVKTEKVSLRVRAGFWLVCKWNASISTQFP
jgi:WD40 repeat protein